MKTLFFTSLIACIFCSVSVGQTITVSGASNTNLNKTYTLCNGCGFAYTTVEVKDVGTDSYFDGPVSGLPFDQYQIYRKDGTWKFAKTYMCGSCTSPSTAIYNTIASNTTKPPCDWGNGISLTGDCVSSGLTSVKAMTVLPTAVTLPQLTATDIEAITSLQKGMLVYDLTNDCVKFYNGTNWKCVAVQP
jgi:predicted RNA-binding Zn-ribbon protein involved in translation (DUF1610 family)